MKALYLLLLAVSTVACPLFAMTGAYFLAGANALCALYWFNAWRAA